MNTMIDTNVKGIFYMLKVILPGMLEKQRPRKSHSPSSDFTLFIEI